MSVYASISTRRSRSDPLYALAGHNDTFTYGGWKISNVSAPGPTMTLDIEKLPVTPAISFKPELGGDATWRGYVQFSSLSPFTFEKCR